MVCPFSMMRFARTFIRNYKVLAIETSCDDACVTVLDRVSPNEAPKIIEERKSTLDSKNAGGVVPTEAAMHNRSSIAKLVNEVVLKHGRPDLVCATRGPGMVGSLVGGYQLAQGLSIAWGTPLIGVNHMLGHLLVARMASNGGKSGPTYPFLSLLVSGGHTMLVLSKGLLQHEILVDTIDIAAGDALDKCGRALGISGNMIGKEAENFLNEHREEWGKPVTANVTEPLLNQWDRRDVLQFSFASFESQVKNTLKKHYDGIVPNDDAIRARLLYTYQETVFKHMLNKTKLAIKKHALEVADFVCSGGVASNMRLRNMLEQELTPLGIKNFHFPPAPLCTDNATMIGWAGIELYEAGIRTAIGKSVIRRWPLTELKELTE